MKNLDLSNYHFKDKIINLFFYFGIATYPLYFFKSGSIQISHFFLLLFSVFVLVRIGITKNKYFFTFLFFLFYCYFVNFFYFYRGLLVFNEADIGHLKSLLFLTYNFILMISIISYLKFKDKSKEIFYGVLSAILIISFYILFEYFDEIGKYRFSGPFNNPNQLGYFCACTFSFIYLFYRNLYIPYLVMISLIILLNLIAILTLSKAAIVALFLCSIFTIKPLNFKYSKFISILVILFTLFVFLIFLFKILDTNLYERLSGIRDESDSSLEVRGYLVFFKASLSQFFFGMGPKNVLTHHYGNEIHSTFAMVLTSYGIIGLLIFGFLISFWIFDIKKMYGIAGVICICGPFLLYGLTHNGIRFSFFWVLFAVTICMSNKIIKNPNLVIKNHYKIVD